MPNRKRRSKAADARGRRDPVPIDEMSAEHREIYFEVAQLYVFIAKAYPESHIVRRLFGFAVANDVDNHGGSLADCDAALDLFYKQLPERERRRVMNGWRPVLRAECDTLAEVIEANGGEVAPVLSISAGNDHAHAYGQTILTDNIRGVECYVHVGTPRHQAIKELGQILDYVTLHFDRAIVDEVAANKEADISAETSGDLAKFLANTREAPDTRPSKRAAHRSSRT